MGAEPAVDFRRTKTPLAFVVVDNLIVFLLGFFAEPKQERYSIAPGIIFTDARTMSNPDDLGEWNMEERHLGDSSNVDSALSERMNTSVDRSMESLDDPLRDSKYLMYDGYDSYGHQSDDSSTSSDSDDEPHQRDKALVYQNGTDLNSIPIQRDGMAVCEKCGAIGVKHAFYSKSKRFCSLACSRSYAMLQREGKPIPKPQPKLKFQLNKVKPYTKRDTGTAPSANTKKSKIDLSRTFDWLPYLNKAYFQSAPVSCFRHVPLSDSWDNITVGMKVEVENKDSDNFQNVFPKAFWIATVVKIAGYKALLRYEGFGNDSSKDFWLNLCAEVVHPVGWCAAQGKPLIPPKTIHFKYTDWKEFLVKRLTGARTLPVNFYLKTQEALESRFRPGTQLEVVDKNRISSMRVATVDEVIGGRLHVNYVGADQQDEGFWCHERSPLIHPIGWSQVVGHSMQASLEYAKRSLQKTLLKQYDTNDATWEMFMPIKNVQTNLKFKEGMKLEAIDPLNLSTICVATVMKVLRNNYLMIGIDGYSTEKGSDWFCYQAASPCIFPVGFCEINGIHLTTPRGHKGDFKWFDYLKETKSLAAPVALFNKELPNHGFRPGMCLEAVDLMEPRLICVATVAKVVGRLLRVHFDGWEDTYDQWCDCESPDMYPVGWCEVVGYHLEPPRLLEFVDKKKMKKPKNQIYRGPRKKNDSENHRTQNEIDREKKPKIVITGRPKVNGKTGSTGKNRDQNNRSSQLNHAPGANRLPASSSSSSEESDAEESSLEAAMPNKVNMDSNSGRKIQVPAISAGPVAKQEVPVSMASNKTIPRLIDANSNQSAQLSVITPELWSIQDVAQFLRVNDCGAYCDSFSKKRIDGRKFLTLTKEQIVNLTGMKVGPSLKIYDLIQQLKAKVHVS